MKRWFMADENTESCEEEQARQKSTRGEGICNSPGTGSKICDVFFQELADVHLKDMTKYFQLEHRGSVSFIIHQIRAKKRNEKSFAARL